MTNSASSLDRTTLADMYRRAAQGMERYDDPPINGGWEWAYSCCAIEGAGGCKEDQRRYVAVFSPGPEWAYPSEVDLQLAFGDGDSQEARNIRILALCFMAAMVEAGDD